MSQQSMDALARANVIRLARADLKRQIRAGQITVPQILRNVPEEAMTMTITELVTAQHRWGKDRTRRLCQRLTISELRPIGRLTVRERERVCGLLTYSHDGPVEWAA